MSARNASELSIAWREGRVEGLEGVENLYKDVAAVVSTSHEVYATVVSTRNQRYWSSE